MHFRLLGTNGFHVKANNERFTGPGSRCRQNLKYENLRRHLVDYIKEFHQKAWRTCSTNIFPALSWSMPSSFLKLPIILTCSGS